MGNRVPKKVRSYAEALLNVLNKPQRKHFVIYLTGIIRIVKFRSIKEIARQFAKSDTDGLHHFIKNTAQKTVSIENAGKQHIVNCLKGEDAVLIIDDTACRREGKRIEGIGIHYAPGGLIKGLCAVTAIIKNGRERFAWAIKEYRTKQAAGVGAFKSKVDIAVDILREARSYIQHKHVTVLFDAWYTCAPVLNEVIAAGWTFVAAIKQNRKVYIGSRKTRVCHLAKGPRRYKRIRYSKKRYLKIAKQVVYLPKVGRVALFICKHRKERRFIITNSVCMEINEVANIYRQRFDIELFHKDIKQHLGFGEMFVRSDKSVQKHWTLVAVAYNTVSLWNGEKRTSFRKKIRHIRDSVSNNLLIQIANTT